MFSTLTKILKSAAALALVAVAAQAGASTVAVGLLGSTNASLGNTFNNQGTYTDYYTFTIGAGSNGIAGTTTDTSKTSTVRDVSITQYSLTGGTLASALTDSTSADGFSFAGLGAGSYTLAVTVNVSTTSAFLFNNLSSYTGNYSGSFRALAAPASPLASPAPEPADFAMALMGLVGVGVMVRRRAR